MHVLLFDKKTGKLITNVPVVISGANFTPTEQEYLNEAWRCAVEDKVVNPNLRDQYTFQLLRE